MVLYISFLFAERVINIKPAETNIAPFWSQDISRNAVSGKTGGSELVGLILVMIMIALVTYY